MSKKSKSKKEERYNKKSLIKAMMSIFSSDPSKSFNYKQLSQVLGIKDVSTRRLINEVLYDLADQGLLKEVYRGKFKIAVVATQMEGVIRMESDGNGYVVTDDGQEVYISEYNLNHALHGDRVKVALVVRHKKKRTEAEVVDIIERADRTYVGRIEMEPNYAFVVPVSKIMPYDVFIPKGASANAKDGQKVIVRITEWPLHTKSPVGEVVEVLGDPGVHEVEMHAILAEYDLPYGFPKELDAHAEKISDKITAKDYRERRDFRDIPTFTIDPVDAKDFDDALSIRKLDTKTFEVGIHIADVTHYVTPGSPIDMEAQDRATSVYLVDRCVPMLPERLSNYICSLRPDEEKLCFSAVFQMDTQGGVLDQWFGRTVIKSKRRFSYEEVQQIIESGEGEFSTEILSLNSIAQKLRDKRRKSGAIDFDRLEVQFELDDAGKPLGVSFVEHKESNQLIEELMLLANRRVAEYIGNPKEGQKPRPFVYRIHDKPNAEKFESFRNFIVRFGYHLEGVTEKQISNALNRVLAEAKGKKEQNLIETLALRAMAKARYSSKNIGHYGLAFPYYTHFTSPIRRYPDMMVHRLLAAYLEGGKGKNSEELEHLCVHSTDMEIRATDAERASIKYKQVEFMADKIGQHFKGVITGVAGFGFFVELLETKCEGLVPVRELLDDYYDFDEDSYSLVGRQTNRRFQLGDEVEVEVWRANLPKKQLDFKLTESINWQPAPSKPKNPKPKRSRR